MCQIFFYTRNNYFWVQLKEEANDSYFYLLNIYTYFGIQTNWFVHRIFEENINLTLVLVFL